MVRRPLLHPGSAFIVTGFFAIIAGGAISAFGAGYPSQLAMWLVAYLVLVEGIVQIAFGTALYMYARTAARQLQFHIYILFSAANIVVLGGVLTEHLSLVIGGAVGLAIASALTARLTIYRPVRFLQALFGALLVALVGSAIIGVLMSLD